MARVQKKTWYRLKWKDARGIASSVVCDLDFGLLPELRESLEVGKRVGYTPSEDVLQYAVRRATFASDYDDEYSGGGDEVETRREIVKAIAETFSRNPRRAEIIESAAEVADQVLQDRADRGDLQGEDCAAAFVARMLRGMLVKKPVREVKRNRVVQAQVAAA